MAVRDRVQDALVRLQNMKPDSVAVLSDQTQFERIVTTVAGRAIYDWSAISSDLFPTGNVADFDLNNAAALGQWQKIRADQHAVLRDAVRDYIETDYVAGKPFVFASGGLSVDVAHTTFYNMEPVQFDRQAIVDAFLHVGMIYTPEAFLPTNDPQYKTVNCEHYTDLFERNPSRITARVLSLAEQLYTAHCDRLQTYDAIPVADRITDLSKYIRTLRDAKDKLEPSRVFRMADQHLAVRGISLTPTVTPAPKGKPLAEILADRVREAQRKQDPTTALDAFNNFGILGRRANNANASRTWGIELEVTDAGGVPTPAGWLKERDGSLRPMIGDGRLYDPWEFVSPILRKTYDPGLRELCSHIENSVQYVRAGVHVHVSATDVKGNKMSTYQVSRLIEIYAVISRLLDPVIQRDERDFCVPTRTEDWAHGWFRRDYPNKYKPGHPTRGRATGMHADAYENAKLNAQMTNSADPNNEPTSWKRYQEVNLQSLNKHGTIEFRSMGPVYRFEYLSRWAWFLRELVNIAANESISTKQVYRFTTLDEVMTWVTMHAVEKLGTPKAKKATTTKKRAVKALQTV